MWRHVARSVRFAVRVQTAAGSMAPLKSYNPQAAVASRTAPAPLITGVSRRKLPAATVSAMGDCIDHWLSKCQGEYEHPAQRWLFEMAHELKALIEPLRAEEYRKAVRLRHMEQMLSSWNE